MVVRRVVPDLHAEDPAAAAEFYAEVLGLEMVMDLGWVVTVAAPENRGAQLTLMRGTPPPPRDPRSRSRSTTSTRPTLPLSTAAPRSSTRSPTSRGACGGSSCAIPPETS